MGEQVGLIGRVEKRIIAVVDYDAAWPRHFEVERDRIDQAFGRRSAPGGSCRVHNCDGAFGQADGGSATERVRRRGGGFLSVSAPIRQCSNQLDMFFESASGHIVMLRTPALDVHVHVCSIGSEWERRHPLFRDWLRESESDRAKYAEVKEALAREDWLSMNHYADAKSGVIDEITTRAEKWAAMTGWSQANSLRTDGRR